MRPQANPSGSASKNQHIVLCLASASKTDPILGGGRKRPQYGLEGQSREKGGLRGEYETDRWEEGLPPHRVELERRFSIESSTSTALQRLLPADAPLLTLAAHGAGLPL